MGTFIAPAFGADKIITSANTCTVDVLGVSDNNATANTIATWDLIDYTLDPGEYLKVTDTSVTETTCPAGSYCVGGGYTVETANNSIAQCPTGYPNSANGASADTQCYTACTVDMVAKATAVTGNDYYGTGVDTCGATACETGYHVDGGGIELVEKDPLIPVDYMLSGDGYAYIDANGTSGNSNLTDAGLTENNTWAAHFDYGTVYGKASCQDSTNPAIYILVNTTALFENEMTIEDFKIGLEPLAGKVKTEYIVTLLTEVKAGIKGENELFQALYGLFMTDYNADYNTGNTGQYCYCQIDRFVAADGDNITVDSAPWVFNIGLGGFSFDDNCSTSCAIDCAGDMQHSDSTSSINREAAFGALGYTESGGICIANTINIDWNPDNGGDHIKNMCTYEGEITLPTPDPVKPGYTFTGWKLVE